MTNRSSPCPAATRSMNAKAGPSQPDPTGQKQDCPNRVAASVSVVPVLTRRGTAFPGRVAASLLYAAGLPELVTENPEAYENLAVRLATVPDALAALKAKMTRRCPLFDTDLFRRNIETAYARMWE